LVKREIGKDIRRERKARGEGNVKVLDRGLIRKGEKFIQTGSSETPGKNDFGNKSPQVKTQCF